jgi:hypothetical protein
MGIPAIITRSFNLAFRSQEARAKSPATTLWGLIRLAQKPKSEEAALAAIGRRVLSGRITSTDLMFLSDEAKSVLSRAFEKAGISTGTLTSSYMLNPTLAALAQNSTDPETLAELCRNTNTVHNFTVGYDDTTGRKDVRAQITIGRIAALNPHTRPTDAAKAR